MAISPQDGGTAAEAAKRPALKAVETAPEARRPGRCAGRSRLEAGARGAAPAPVEALPRAERGRAGAGAGARRRAPSSGSATTRRWPASSSSCSCRSRPRSAISTSAPRTSTIPTSPSRSARRSPARRRRGSSAPSPGSAAAAAPRSPTSCSSTSAARRSSRRSTREIDLRAIYNREPEDWVFSLGEDATIEDLARALEPDGGRELREPLRHHPGARHRLHPRGRPGDHPGDPGEVDRAGEPPGRAGAHRRDPLRQGRPRRGRGAPARPAPGARELPPRAPDGRSRRPTWRGRWGSSTALQGELAKALVERDMLLTYAEPADQRVQQANRRITAISDRIEDERATLGAPGTDGEDARGGGRLRGAQGRPRVRLPGLYPGARQPGRSPAPRRGGSRATSRRTWSRRSPRARSIPAGRCSRGWSGSSCCSAGASLMLVYYNVRDSR